MISGTPGMGSAMWGQLQQQQAQRNADQAEQRARALQQQAAGAQAQADRAQERARGLQVESDQATGEATQARQNVSSMRSLQTLDSQFSELREQISRVTTSSSDSASAPAGSGGVTNSFGQTTGTLINVTA